MPKDKMEAVLEDLQLLQALCQEKNEDYFTSNQKETLFQGVLQKHDITQQILDSSLVYYSEKIELYNKINEGVVTKLTAQSEVYEKVTKAEQKKEEDRRQRTFPLFAYLTSDEPFFSFNLDSAKLQTPDFVTANKLYFDLLGLSPQLQIKLSARFEYADTTILKTSIISNSSDTLFYPQLKDKTLKNLSGSIRVQSSTPDYKLMLYNICLGRDSLNTVEDPKTVQETLKETVQETVKETVSKDVVNEAVTIDRSDMKLDREKLRSLKVK